MSIRILARVVACSLLLAVVVTPGRAQSPAGRPIPHGQDRAPGPALSPDEALRRMTVPEGFSVELVASEPDIVNPVAMTIDEKGRFWITESVEYPRRAAGKGRDRVKVLEDTDGDGRADKVTIFAEGLNIPSGIAVGYGGVWVANAPDLLFLRDTDGDGRADESKVVVTGFGRRDTHELPNSLTWGPDGWLYGLNGVFNPSHIRHRGRDHRFTCALFRIDPRPAKSGPWKGTHDFQVFCEGTSNPWGIAFDPLGSAFVSACVIDHLWHLTETGYYHRQGGPYPPFTWKIGSIVDHRHQKAAYCGLHFFDSDAYPPEYRERLYMGNIHGGCINVDRLRRDGSTYRAEGCPDFLTANDAWFMPVVQKTGPDGCLYVLDWYDRYHCYQDANRDPEGIDRLKGRLYRVRYGDAPRAPRFDLSAESDQQLIERLSSPNVFFRNRAQRLLAERASPGARRVLERMVMADGTPDKARRHALWALISGGPLDESFHGSLLAHDDPVMRSWGVRAAGNRGAISESLRGRLVRLSRDPSPDVCLQVAIAAPKIEGLDPVPVLVRVLATTDGDKLVPHIVWQNLLPLLETRAADVVAELRRQEVVDRSSVARLLPQLFDRLLAGPPRDQRLLASLFQTLRGQQVELAGRLLERLAGTIQTRQLSADQWAALRPELEPAVAEILGGRTQDPLYPHAALVAASWQDPRALAFVRRVVASTDHSASRRVAALEALVANQDGGTLAVLPALLERGRESAELRRRVLGALSRWDEPRVADVVLDAYGKMEPEVRPAAVELLTQRPAWTRRLLTEIQKKQIPRDDVNLTQLRKLVSGQDPSVKEQVRAIWGKVRMTRNPERAAVIRRVRRLTQNSLSAADLASGEQVFNKKCAVCHVLRGKGEKVGPDITSNGRASFEQLLSNVLDPNLVIGDDYQARILLTRDGRTLTGLVAEENAQRVVLRLQGGKTETVARRDIEQLKVSQVSMMPENVEEGLSDEQLRDLMAFLAAEIGPDGKLRWIPGVQP